MTIVWLIACLAIIGAGIYAGKGISAKQWSGGDRSLGPVAVGCILAATQIGGMSIIGAAQNGYMLGISAIVPIPLRPSCKSSSQKYAI